MGNASGLQAKGPSFLDGFLDALRASVAPLLPRLLFGMRLAASVCLALFVTYDLELDNPFWAATTAAIVCQPNLGASLQKGRFRILGTLVGALAMIVLLSLFAQQRDTLILGLAVFCGLCGFAAVILRNFASSAAALAGITATIIFADTLADPTSAVHLAIIRVTEIGIGIGATGLVFLLTDLGAARHQLAGALQSAARHVSTGFLATLTAEAETPAMRMARRDIVRSLGPLDNAIDAAIGESAYLRSRAGHLRATSGALLDALVAWRNLGSHSDGTGPRVSEALRRDLAVRLGRIDPGLASRDPGRLQEICGEVVAQIGSLRAADAAGCLAIAAAREVAIALGAVAGSTALLHGREAKPWRWRREPFVVADPLPAVVNGVRAFAAVLATAIFWVATAWPAGPFAIVFAAVGTLIFGTFGDQARALAKDYAIGAALMAMLGCVLYFAVLPSLSSFVALAAILFPFFAVLGVMQAGPWHPVVFLAMTITSLPLLGIGNPIAYSASNYFNLVLAIMAGTIAGTLFFVVLPVIGPEARIRRLLSLSLRDIRRLARTGQTRERTRDVARWTALTGRRIEALPPQATPAEGGSLMMLLALGRAILALADAPSAEPDRRVLSRAFAHLAGGRPAAARRILGTLTEIVADGAILPSETGAPLDRHPCAALAVIVDAIDRYPDLLAGRIGTRDLFPSPSR